jgi:glycosyltransferase involved in cell wall biosynthesis
MGKESRLMEWTIHRLFNFLLFGRVPLVQCPSQFAADMLRRNGCDSELRVVSNGIPGEYVVRSHERPDFYADNLVLMNVGRHALEKRQSLIIDGVKRSRYADKITLMLCGKGEMTDELVRLGDELPNKPLIRYVSNEEKLQYLNTADLYVHGSIVELESLSCLEAVGCGLPCLIGDSRYSAAPQFALDDRFLFHRDDADHLARRIDYWYEHKDELRASRARVLEMAEQYRFERCLDLMEDIYWEFERETYSREPTLAPEMA